MKFTTRFLTLSAQQRGVYPTAVNENQAQEDEINVFIDKISAELGNVKSVTISQISGETYGTKLLLCFGYESK